ncbi:MAG: response regulator transcription factor [Lachnotalea sp.]
MNYQLLLVEDDLLLQEAVADYFKSKKWDVTCISNGSDAVDTAQNQDFHLILLDIMLPKQDGFQACKKIRQVKDVPIIFITARVSEEDELNGYAKGADDYVTKPFSLPVLYAKAMAHELKTPLSVIRCFSKTINSL